MKFIETALLRTLAAAGFLVLATIGIAYLIFVAPLRALHREIA